jgi:hypothetical protein
MDFEVQRCTRHCAASGRELAEGEEFYSAIVAEGADVRRLDYAVEGWQGPPQGAMAWWKSRMPTREARKSQLAPSEALLELFANLEEVADKQDMRYVMALLLVRRRILRLEDTETDPQDREVLVLYCPRDESTHRVTSVVPDESRANEIQNELAGLLFAGAA